VKRRTHWTISALKDYETCPARYEWSYLFEPKDWAAIGYKVVPAKGSPAMERGTEIHETCENFINGTSPGLHAEIGPAWAAWVRDLKEIGAKAEAQWELDCDWHPSNRASDLWLRMKVDAHYPIGKDQMHVIDYKTGKPWPANIEQVEVYALGAFAKYDDVNEVIGSLWYFDSDEPHDKTFTRAQAPKLARKWEQRAARLLEATEYPKKPNRFCNWCPYSHKKGGPCGYPT
jgi:hypothetical protein